MIFRVNLQRQSSGSRDIVKRFIGIVIAILLLGYGVVRMGVGALLLAQTLDIVNFPDLAEGVAEVKLFIDARANYQILPFSLNGYFGYILAMGVLLSAGAGGVIARAQWGFKTLGVYMVMHAALFVNFQEINPKLLVLILQIIMLFTLYYLMPPVKLLETEQSDS
jgi:hypothetical protein